MDINKYLWPEDLAKFPEQAMLMMRVISKWNRLEHFSISLFSIVIRNGLEPSRLIWKSVISSKARIDLLGAAGEQYLAKHKPNLTADFNKLIKALQACLAARGVYAHAIFVSDERGRLCIRKDKYAWPDDPKSVNIVDAVALENDVAVMERTERLLLDLRDLLWNSLTEEEREPLR